MVALRKLCRPGTSDTGGNARAPASRLALPALRSGGATSVRAVRAQVTQHGACLGLGLAALGTGDEEAFEDLKGVLYTDSAVAGEAAGLALGLLCVGSATDKAGELLAYAHDTQHEKARAAPPRSPSPAREGRRLRRAGPAPGSVSGGAGGGGGARGPAGGRWLRGGL